jgi:hypothetical protein
MKRILILTTALLQLAQLSHAQWIVQDPTMLAQTLINTYIARDQLDIARSVASRLGDAAILKQVPGAAAVLQSLRSASTEASSDSSKPCTGLGALSYDGNKLYQIIGESMTAPDGTVVKRQAETYKKFEAAHQTVNRYLEVIRETDARRSALLQGIKSTTEAIQTADSLAEVQKLQAIAATQVAALNSIEGARATALGAVVVQSLDNSTDQSKQERARAEERSVDFQTASASLARFLTPMASTVTIPDRRGFHR